MNVNIYLRALNLAVLFLSHHSVFTTQFIYVNLAREKTNQGDDALRLIFNSLIEINHADNMNLSVHNRVGTRDSG